MSAVPLPAWVFERDSGVHAPAGSYGARRGQAKPRSALPVYARQLFPDRVLGERRRSRHDPVGERRRAPVAARRAMRHRHRVDPSRARPTRSARTCWTACSRRSRAPSATRRPGDLAAEAAVLGRRQPRSRWRRACRRAVRLLEKMVAKFQQHLDAIKHAQVPVVAAVHGMALGGGCEFVMHAAHRVALESYIGLVEAGVGLIPAGGGCKEFALQRAMRARAPPAATSSPHLQNVFQTDRHGHRGEERAGGAQLGFLRDPTWCSTPTRSCTSRGRRRARWRSRLAAAAANPAVTVAGRNGIATLRNDAGEHAEGGFISAHDYRVAKARGHRAVRRRGRHRHAGERAVAPRRRARASSSSC
jgi:3-hydroxyacyl-CoA dehydrogenase